MTYLEAQELITQIERKYDVSSIRYKGVPVWPFLRLYLLDNLSTKRARGGSVSNVWLIIKRLFAYNPLCLFKKYKVWLYNAACTRKEIEGKYISCISGAIPDLCHSTLTIENPESAVPSYRKSLINDRYIISNAWSIMIIRGLEIFERPFKIKIHNESLLKKIMDDCNSDFDYRKYVRFLYNQKIVVDLLLLVSGKPNVVFMIDAYDQMGYVWSFHNHSIPVVELQHGVLNKSHIGYNCPIDTKIFAPDEICVFGEKEYKYLINKYPKYANLVTKTGMFFLDKVNEIYDKDIFSEYRLEYKKIIVVSGQTGYEEILSRFIDGAAKINKDFLYIYIPRRFTNITFTQKNVLLKNGINIYPYLKFCDIHCTIFSTTCLEAHFFRKINIFYDYNGFSSSYYKEILDVDNGAYYVTNEYDFTCIANSIEKNNISFLELYSKDHINKINVILRKYLL